MAVVRPLELPVYPAMLANARVGGAVLVQFVVSAQGKLDTSTVRVLKSTHDLFTESVRSALAHWRARPARIRARPVAQVAQVEVDFATTCDHSPDTPKSIVSGESVTVCGEKSGESAARASHARASAAPDDDTLLVRSVLESVLGKMGAELSYVVEGTAPFPWTVHVPAGAAWARSAAGLHRLLNARDVAARDTMYRTLDIERTARGDSTAAYDVGVALYFHCPGDRVHWIGSSQSFQIAARRGWGGYWSTTTTLAVMGDPAECR